MLLAIPSVIIGWLTIGPLLFGGYFGDAIAVLPQHDVLGAPARGIPRARGLRAARAARSPAVWLAAAGVAAAWFLYLKRPELAAQLRERAGGALHAARQQVLLRRLQRERACRAAAAGSAQAFWRGGDVALIDGAAVNGSARLVGWVAGVRPRPADPATSITTRSR